MAQVDSYQVKLSYGHPSVARPRVPNLSRPQTKASVQLIGDSVSAAWSSRNSSGDFEVNSKVVDANTWIGDFTHLSVYTRLGLHLE